MLNRLLTATAFGIVMCPSAIGQSALRAEEVSVFDTSDVTVTFGRVTMTDRKLPGGAALIDDGASAPKMNFLGCRFEVVLEPENVALQRAAPVFSKKLTTPNSDPPPAGFGRLTRPAPVGVTDPVTSVACSDKLNYFVFFYRQKPTFGLVEIETVVLEYDDAGRVVFEAETFDPIVERPSAQTANVVTAARGFYRMNLRAPADALMADKEQTEFQKRLLGLAFTVGPKIIGIPIP
ncbi:MAG: hypothetical protein Q8R82_09025 [Hyphomonadaceae bacterium]|nr:hypothetical protein [Hyphomonadaceae bacterium]